MTWWLTAAGVTRPADVEGAGDGWNRDAYLRLPATKVPIYIGAMSPRMLAFAGAEADGVLALLFYVWALLVSGWLLAQGVRTSEPVAV